MCLRGRVLDGTLVSFRVEILGFFLKLKGREVKGIGEKGKNNEKNEMIFLFLFFSIVLGVKENESDWIKCCRHPLSSTFLRWTRCILCLKKKKVRSRHIPKINRN